MLIGTILGSLVQLAVFSMIPFLFYVIRHKRVRGFPDYLGFYAPEAKAMTVAFFFSFMILGLFLGSFHLLGILDLMKSPTTSTGMLIANGLNWETFLSLLLIAWFQTSLAEEILFRGFIGSILIRRFGFKWGNLFQAVAFSVLHVILLHSLGGVSSVLPIVIVFVFMGFVGYSLGYIKERLGNGSIYPGWVAHGLGNTLVNVLLVFGLGG